MSGNQIQVHGNKEWQKQKAWNNVLKTGVSLNIAQYEINLQKISQGGFDSV